MRTASMRLHWLQDKILPRKYCGSNMEILLIQSSYSVLRDSIYDATSVTSVLSQNIPSKVC